MAELSYTQVKKTECKSKKFHPTFLVAMFVPMLVVVHWPCWMHASSEVLEISQEVSEETATSYCSHWTFIHLMYLKF